MQQTDVLIVGAGLAGLSLAEQLQAKGQDYVLAEARARVGGRIKTTRVGGGDFDLGPAWFWPGQPRIAALIQRLGLAPFEQFYQGDLVYEDGQGHVQRGQGFSSMQGSFRLAGGLGALSEALAAGLTNMRVGTAVQGLEKSDTGVVATLSDGSHITARRVVLALPPRVAAAQISFTPTLPDTARQRMAGIATWMAGQAKAVAIYDTAFWRDAGLSGDASSRRGPMVEIHDASPKDGGPYALFGFIGVPPQGRGDETVLREHIVAQLVRLFGPAAGHPAEVLIKDWAFDTATATDLDHAPLYAHPTYELPHEMSGLWDGALVFGGTEVAPEFGGYLEGALEAAENAMALVT